MRLLSLRPQSNARASKGDARMRTVLVTGGAGYVGSHCCKAFASAGWQVITFDNLSRGWREAVRWGELIEGDLLDEDDIADAIAKTNPDLVAHFAAFAYVAESVDNPAIYYRNNCVGSLNLLDAMLMHSCRRLIFSSTCATYGTPDQLPISELTPQRPINPYGQSKLFVEQMLSDYYSAYGLSSISLRYFNAAGADSDGEIGEHHEPETHAIPLAVAAAIKEGASFTVMGNDFPTRDGTAVRDYIHVEDLADAHVSAGERLMEAPRCEAYNLGTGSGTSVLELLKSVERVTGKRPVYGVGPRRDGDPPALVAAAEKATAELDWAPSRSHIDRIVGTAVKWQRQNPEI